MSADILVVDDEADIRELVAGLLEDEGYRTRKASSADEAPRAGRIWSSSISGCRAAASMGCRCWS